MFYKKFHNLLNINNLALIIRILFLESLLNIYVRCWNFNKLHDVKWIAKAKIVWRFSAEMPANTDTRPYHGIYLSSKSPCTPKSQKLITQILTFPNTSGLHCCKAKQFVHLFLEIINIMNWGRAIINEWLHLLVSKSLKFW